VTSIRISVPTSDLDVLGHVNQSVYHQYGERARQAAVEDAGGTFEELVASGIAPVLLESHISFRRELRAGDVVDVSCATKFGPGKTFRMEHVITKLDGTLAAEISCTLGMMDLRARKLVTDPRAAFQALGVDVRIMSGS
jgi:acyl-CoA thioester hydrolase